MFPSLGACARISGVLCWVCKRGQPPPVGVRGSRHNEAEQAACGTREQRPPVGRLELLGWSKPDPQGRKTMEVPGHLGDQDPGSVATSRVSLPLTAMWMGAAPQPAPP